MDCRCRTCRRPSRAINHELLAILRAGFPQREIIRLYELARDTMLPRQG
jgi:hypothetical protein